MNKIEFENLVKHLEKRVGEKMPDEIRKSTWDIFNKMDFETAMESLANFDPKKMSDANMKKMVQYILFETDTGQEVIKDFLDQAIPQLQKQIEKEIRGKLEDQYMRFSKN